MQWLKLYVEMLDDQKIGTLTDLQFRVWIEALLVARRADREGDTDVTVEGFAWVTRRNAVTPVLHETVKELTERGLVRMSERGTIVVCNFVKRQPTGSNSAERVRKHRAKKRAESGERPKPAAQSEPASNGVTPDVTQGVTQQKREGNALEESREEKNREEESTSGHAALPAVDAKADSAAGKAVLYSQAFEVAWSAKPSRIGGHDKRQAFHAWNARLKEGHDGAGILAGLIRYRKFVQALGKEGTPFVKTLETFLGPSLHFAEPWSIEEAQAGAKPQDDFREHQGRAALAWADVAQAIRQGQRPAKWSDPMTDECLTAIGGSIRQLGELPSSRVVDKQREFEKLFIAKARMKGVAAALTQSQTAAHNGK